MSEYRGYEKNSLAFLKVNKLNVGDFVKITSDLTYSGILMPRYESSDDEHIVLKLIKILHYQKFFFYLPVELLPAK